MKIIDELRQLYDTRLDEVESWLVQKRKEKPPFVTTSVDLRSSGARLAPVDTNLYPAGFQNLSANGEVRASKHFQSRFDNARKILIIPENHTRNLPYFENLAALRRIILAAGFEVEIGSTAAKESEPFPFTTQSGQTLIQYPLFKKNGVLQTESGFVPDAVLLNNDLTAGVPDILENITQIVQPPVRLGWHSRLKTKHFEEYCKIAEEFANHFSFDKWKICANFKAIKAVNFKAREGVEALAEATDEMIEAAKKKYAEYGIDEEPYVYVKADKGTYGMGILVVKSGEEVLEMNKKERNKMHVIKEGVEVSDVILQEGIPTIDSVAGKPAEPMIYLVDGVPVGGMYRANASRDVYGNLNASGMEYVGMCDEIEQTFDCREVVKNCDFRVYGLIAALAALAAGRE